MSASSEPSRAMVDLFHDFLNAPEGDDVPTLAPAQPVAEQLPPVAPERSTRTTDRRRRDRLVLPPLSAPVSDTTLVVDQGEPGDPSAPPADDAAPTGAAPGEPEDELTRLRRENQELNQKIQAREWSSQGRYLQEKAARERLEAELAAATKRDEDANAAEDRRWDDLIAQTQDPASRATLEAFAETDKARRAAEAELAKIRREAERTQAINKTLQDGEARRLESEVRDTAIPTLLDHLTERANAAGIPAATAQLLAAAIDTPDFRELTQTMPVQLLGRTVFTRMGWIDQQIARLQEEVAAQNRIVAANTGQFGRRETTPEGTSPPRRRAPERLTKTHELATALDELEG